MTHSRETIAHSNKVSSLYRKPSRWYWSSFRRSLLSSESNSDVWFRTARVFPEIIETPTKVDFFCFGVVVRVNHRRCEPTKVFEMNWHLSSISNLSHFIQHPFSRSLLALEIDKIMKSAWQPNSSKIQTQVFGIKIRCPTSKLPDTGTPNNVSIL